MISYLSGIIRRLSRGIFAMDDFNTKYFVSIVFLPEPITI